MLVNYSGLHKKVDNSVEKWNKPHKQKVYLSTFDQILHIM